jgi:two-component system chemotaxis response regulator CheY
MAKILQIDDSAFMMHYSRGFLEEAGHEVQDFLPSSAMELLDRIKADRPDLVLSDYNMPLVDGQTVVRTLRRADPSIPVVILTANRDLSRESILRTMGVRQILHKPVKGEDLVQAVKTALTPD